MISEVVKQPVVLINWKELAVLTSLFCGGLSAFAFMLYRVYKITSMGIGLIAENHIKPALGEISKDLKQVSEALNSMKFNHESEAREISHRFAHQDNCIEENKHRISELEVRVDGHDDDINSLESKVAVLEEFKRSMQG